RDPGGNFVAALILTYRCHDCRQGTVRLVKGLRQCFVVSEPQFELIIESISVIAARRAQLFIGEGIQPEILYRPRDMPILVLSAYKNAGHVVAEVHCLTGITHLEAEDELVRARAGDAD